MVFHITDRDHAPAIVQSHDNSGSMISRKTNRDHALDLFSFFEKLLSIFIPYC